MFGIGISEIILIVVVAVIVVGPKNLPIALRAIGRAIAEFRRAMDELRKDVALDEVVEEVTRPLREGMAGIEAEMLNVTRENTDGYGAEYPVGGADVYDAMPEGAMLYPEVGPTYKDTQAEALAQYPGLPPAKAQILYKQEQWALQKANYLESRVGIDPNIESEEAYIARMKQAAPASAPTAAVATAGATSAMTPAQQAIVDEKLAYLARQKTLASETAVPDDAPIARTAGDPGTTTAEPGAAASAPRTAAVAPVPLVVKSAEDTVPRSRGEPDE